MAISKYTRVGQSTSCTVLNRGPIDEFNKLVSTSPVASSVLVSFDNLTDTSVDISHQVVRVTGSNTLLDLCYVGLMYNRPSGTMYYAPDTTSNFVALIDFKLLIETLINNTFARQVDIPLQSLDNFVQNTKIGHVVDKNAGLPGLLEELVNYYKKSSQKTVIGKLLFGDVNGPDLHVDNDLFLKFMQLVSVELTRITKSFVKAMSSVEVNTAGVLNTSSEICKTTEHVFDSDGWKKVEYIMDKGLHPLTSELSTNVIFNPTSREYIGKLIDPSSKDGFTRDSNIEKSYDRIMKIMNAQDYMSDPSYQIFATIGNTTVPISAMPDESEFDFKPDYTSDKLVRIRQVRDMIDTIDSNKVSLSTAKSTLDSIEQADDSLVDPSIFALTDRLMRNLTKLLNRSYN